MNSISDKYVRRPGLLRLLFFTNRGSLLIHFLLRPGVLKRGVVRDKLLSGGLWVNTGGPSKKCYPTTVECKRQEGHTWSCRHTIRFPADEAWSATSWRSGGVDGEPFKKSVSSRL